ncbi:MAG: N-acetylneuraminate synthase [Flavobacteriales bacterium]
MRFDKQIKVADRIVSNDSPVFIIAEAGVNHGGDMQKAFQLIDAAANAGADAVKFQAFKTEHLILSDVDKAPYQTKTTSSQESQYDMLKRLEVTYEQNVKLKDYCISRGIIFLTTPFDEHSLHELDRLELAAYKVASTDLTNLPFLIEIAKKGRPIFLSTGMSYLSEVEMALQEIEQYNKQVVLLACTANYPIKDEEANLNNIETFRDTFEMLVGYSDHTVGVGAAPFSVPMGAKVVEKHFTLDKTEQGPDHRASLLPDELKNLVAQIRRIESYMGSHQKVPTVSELGTRASLQKCMVAKTAIKQGEMFSTDNITAKRTGGEGVSPLYFRKVIGKAAEKDYAVNQLIEVN